MHIVEQSEAGGSRYGRLAAMVAESESETEEGQTSSESDKERTASPLLRLGCELYREVWAGVCALEGPKRHKEGF